MVSHLVVTSIVEKCRDYDDLSLERNGKKLDLMQPFMFYETV